MTEKEIIYGRNPVVEVIRGSRHIYRLWLTKQTAKALGADIRKADIRPKIVSRGEIGSITGRRDHQSAAVETDAFEYTPIDLLRELRSGLILAADGITDPRNLGATIRSAVLLGAAGIIIPEKGSALITPVVCHTSAGATEHIAIAYVPNLAHELEILKARGFEIAGAVVPGPNTTLISDYDPPEKIVLVIGGEGAGISGRILSKCDIRLSIPQRAVFDSFNVSVAASIILYELLKSTK